MVKFYSSRSTERKTVPLYRRAPVKFTQKISFLLFSIYNSSWWWFRIWIYKRCIQVSFSKYIQNSSLKVFEEVLVKKKKKALFLQQTIKKEVSYLWRDSRLKVEFFCCCLLYSWSPDYRWRRGKRKAKLVIVNSHLPLEEEQGCHTLPRQCPDPRPHWVKYGLIVTSQPMRRLPQDKVLAFSPKKAASSSLCST